MITGLFVVKAAATFLVGSGTKTIIKEVIKNHVTPDSAFQKVTVKAATIVLSAVVAKQTKKYTDDLITNVSTFVKTTVQSMQDGEDVFDQFMHRAGFSEPDAETPEEAVKAKQEPKVEFATAEPGA